MARQQLIEYHTGRLKDKRKVARRDAIEQLMLLEAIESLEALEDVYRTDPDEEIRQQAKQAGRSIFLTHRAKQSEENGKSPDEESRTETENGTQT